MPEIIGRGSLWDPAALILYTTGNKHYIENERPSYDRPPEAFDEAFRIAKEVSPSIQCRSRTAMYDCVGMVFASRRTCIDAKFLETILSDDGYRRLDGADAVRIGDVAVYRRNGSVQHVGIVYELRDVGLVGGVKRIEIWVLSQWGQDGEYFHKAVEVPVMYGREIEFWTEQRG